MAKTISRMVRQTALEWHRDNALRLSAALAYYTAFSIAPLLIIVISVVGLAFGRDATEGRIVAQFGDLVGREAAEQIQTMIRYAYQPKSGVIGVTIGIVTLLLGAMGVFGQLKDALNTIWKVKPKRRPGVWAFVRDRILSMTMILTIAFLLLASLVVSAAIAAFASWAEARFPGAAALLTLTNVAVSFGIVTALFAMIYKILPDADIAWRDVWLGAAVTSLLFVLGKQLIGLYLGRSAVGSVYGAAGSFVVLLVWIYYSSAVFLLGAEFTEVYARKRAAGTVEERPREDEAHEGLRRAAGRRAREARHARGRRPARAQGRARHTSEREPDGAKRLLLPVQLLAERRDLLQKPRLTPSERDEVDEDGGPDDRVRPEQEPERSHRDDPPPVRVSGPPAA